MVIVNILGGLGNQMFQYAMGKSISLHSNQELKLDITEFENYDLRNFELDTFHINVDIASKQEVERLKYLDIGLRKKIYNLVYKNNPQYSKHYYKEKFYHFDNGVFNINNEVYLFGYWQSEKYFIDYKDEILKTFKLKQPLSEKSSKYLDSIQSTSSISLHIRRGDYVDNAATNSYHGTCSLNYYQRAVEKILNKTKDPHFYIFSDDLPWVKENLSFIEDMTFVELPKEVPDHEEMYLMSQCQHNIIANSSFSWWGAWLNQNEEKIVIAPKKWFNDTSINTDDLIPKSWIQL